MPKIFVNIKLSKWDFCGFRIGGAGLGNLLFPWARGIIFKNKYNTEKLNCTWSTVKVGTFIRKEKDKRTYHNIFFEDYVGGIKKFLLLLLAKKITESEAQNLNSLKGKIPIVINFEGMRNQMNDILDHSTLVKEELYKMVRKKHIELSEKNKPEAIGIHIRLGDFYKPQSESEIRKGLTNCRLPLEWYIEIINKIRTEARANIKVSVFSDGTDEELAVILNLPNVERAVGGSAISDLLSLSKGKILIASNSTFSLWASYLGRPHTIWFPGTHRIKLFKENEAKFESEIDYNDDLDPNLIDFIKKIEYA